MRTKISCILFAAMICQASLGTEPETEYQRQVDFLRKQYSPKIKSLESAFEADAKELHKAALEKLSNATKFYKESNEDDALQKAVQYNRRWREFQRKKLPTLIRVSAGRRALQRQIAELQTQLDALLGLNQQLVANPGCEEIDENGSIARWTVEEGSWAAHKANHAKGKLLFYAGKTSRSVLTQEIHADALSEQSGVAKLRLTASVDLWCLPQKPADSGELVVELLNADRATIETYSSGKTVSKNTWRNLSLSELVPLDTRYISVKLIAHRTGPRGSKSNDANFDDVSLVLSRATEGSR